MNMRNLMRTSGRGIFERPFGAHDIDAQAYIDALITAGATLTSAQEAAVNAYVSVAKNAGWWPKIVEVFLWTYGSAAPNAVGIKGTTGAFTGGGWAYATGYAQGNGTTDYFDPLINGVSAGLTPNDACMSFSTAEAPSAIADVPMGAVDGLGQIVLSFVSTKVYSYIGNVNNAEGTISAEPLSFEGLFTGNKLDGTHKIFAGTSELLSVDRPAYGNIPDRPIYFAARSHYGTAAYAHTDYKYNMFGVLKGLTPTELASYTSATQILIGAL